MPTITTLPPNRPITRVRIVTLRRRTMCSWFMPCKGHACVLSNDNPILPNNPATSASASASASAALGARATSAIFTPRRPDQSCRAVTSAPHSFSDRAGERRRLPARGTRSQVGSTRFRRTILQVLVRDNNVDQALRVLKRKMQREGVFREMKRRKAYEKPSERKTREKAEAVRRARKAARKQAQREGLIPMPKRQEPAPRRAPPPRF